MKCTLSICENLVKNENAWNWKSKYCCISHQRQHAGSKGGISAKSVIKKQKEKNPNAPSSLPYKDWDEERQGKWCAYVISRQRRIRKATPQWVNKEEIEEFYIKARILTKETGIKYEVDHIVPIQGKLVSGLHVPVNLQIITKFENISKNNKFTVE
jgi:hypothetical protein